MSSKVVSTDLDSGVLHNEEWLNRWKVKDISFHMPVHAAILDKQEAALFEGKTKSVFAPLCGKSLDLKWMYDKGHTVVGVEVAEQAVQEFFGENSIEYEVQDLENIGKVYKSKDGRVAIYNADLYDVKPEVVGQFDVIYDCRSLVAINVEDHNLYRDLLLSLMKKDGIYYLMTLEYDEHLWPGPPHSTNDKLVKDLYGDRCNIEIIEENISDKKKVEQEGVTEPTTAAEKPQSFGAAIKLFTFIADRWYSMTFK